MASAKTPNNDAQIQPPPAPPHQGSWADQVEEDEDDPNWLQQELERENARNHAIKSGKRPRSENAQIQAPPVPPHQISWADQVEHDEDDPNWLQQELERENARIHAMKSGEPPCSQGPAVTATVEPAVSPHGTISDDQTLPIPSLSLEQPDGSLGLENIEENGLHEAIVSLLHQYGLHVEGDVSFHEKTSVANVAYLQVLFHTQLDLDFGKDDVLHFMPKSYSPAYRSFVEKMNISTTTWEDDLKCDNCLETCRTLQKASFKNCKCNGYRYCSFPECAKAGLSNHKKVCAMGPASRRLVQWECRLIDGPDSSRHRHYHPYFSDEWDRIILASGGLWLRHLPREAVFNVLIDSFRLRQQDEFVLGQEGTDPLQERFQLYLNLMETREGMTPSW